jgi:hypothetical protein
MPGLKRRVDSEPQRYVPAPKRRRSYNKPTGLTSAVSKKIRAVVKKSIMSEAEKKRFVLYASNQSCPTGSSGVTPLCVYIAPELNQGGGDGQRIGNKVKVTKSTLRLMVNLRPYNVTTNPLPPPVWVRVLIVSFKKGNTNNIANTDLSTNLFSVTSGSVPFQGTPLDICFGVNPESWNVYHDTVFKLGATSATSTGPASTGSYLDQSDMTKALEIDIKNIGTMMYQDTLSTPTNKNTWLIIQPITAEGSAASGYIMTECHYVVDTEFIDL